MPELPEVETIRVQLSGVLVGKTIKDIEIRKVKLFKGEKKLVIGKKITGLRRFSKLLVIDTFGGISLAIHLKMTGRLVFNAKCQMPNDKCKNKKQKERNPYWEVDYETDKHTHVVVHFTDGSKLYFHDVRQFGYLQVIVTDKVGDLGYIRSLGKEFLRDLTLKDFTKVLKSSRRAIKVVLMDQTKFAGVGNIYTNEALWCAKIYPKTKANTLSHGYMVTLFNCLENILKQAIKWKGASDNSYRDAFGEKGEVQEHFSVYGRENEPCLRCKAPIQKTSVGGRGTYFCPVCQK